MGIGNSVLVHAQSPGVTSIMTEENRKLATIFTAIANLLSSRGENPHRVRAYRRATDSILQLTEDVRSMAQRGELQTISGIGKELSLKVEEFLDHGTIRTYEELRTPLPVEVKDWVELPGFSEPLVHDLYFRLKITSLDDLERLIRSHLLRTIPGADLQTEEVLEAIKGYREKVNQGTI